MRLSVFPLSSTKAAGKSDLRPLPTLARSPRPSQTCIWPSNSEALISTSFSRDREEKRNLMENGDGDKEKVSLGACLGVGCGLRAPWIHLLTGASSPTDRSAIPAMSGSHDRHAPRKVPPQQNGCAQQVQGEHPPVPCQTAELCHCV